MMPRNPNGRNGTDQEIREACLKAYLNPEISLREISKAYGVAQASICNWVNREKKNGNPDFFLKRNQKRPIQIVDETRMKSVVVDPSRLICLDALMRDVYSVVVEDMGVTEDMTADAVTANIMKLVKYHLTEHVDGKEG